MDSLGAQAMNQLLNPTSITPGPDTAEIDPQDPFADWDKIRTRLNTKLQEWRRGREASMRTAWRNILFYRGHQWIVYDRRVNSWRPANLRRDTPRPVTNRYASTMDAYCSILTRIEPVMTYLPGTDETDDIAAADTAKDIMRVVEDEVDVRLQRQVLGTWAGFTGGAWLESGYDPSPEHGMRMIQDEQCAMCGATQPPSESGTCAQCGGPTMPAFGPAGEPLGTEVPVGKMFVDVVSCFEMFFDPSITDWQQQRECIRKKSLSVDEAKRRWPHLKDQIQPDSGMNTGELYQEQLPTLAGHMEETGTTWQQAAPWNRALAQPNRVTELWYWIMPEPDFPEGCLAIQLGQTLKAYAGPLPYVDRSPKSAPQPFLPFVHFPTKLVPGSLWPKTVADDLALKQVQRNTVESLIIAILRRTANPVWLVPEGSNVTNLTGDPGQVIKYNPLTVNGRPPERVGGQGVPVGVFQQLEQIDRDFEELAATFDVVKGNRPTGVSAGVAIQMLQERAQSRFGGQFILWEQAWAHWNRQALAIFRQFATEPRLLRIMGKNGTWQVKKFMAADLQGSVDVIPEAGSGMPRSTLGERATVEQAVQMGVINIQDPEIQHKILELMDLTNLTPGMRDDTKAAVMQTEAFEALAQNPQAVQIIQGTIAAADQMSQQTGQPITYTMVQQFLAQQYIPVPRIRPSVDGHGIFVLELGNWLKSESSQVLPEPIQRLVEMKHTEHQQILTQSQGQQPPKVNVSLRGDLMPDAAASLAGMPPPGAQSQQNQQNGGSGLLETPNIVQRSRPSPASRSGAQMRGNVREMARPGGPARPGSAE